MAQAIKKIVHATKSSTEVEAERLEAVRKETASDADAVMESLKLLQAMHDRGVLELLTATFHRGDKVLQHLVDVLAQPDTTRTLKNLVAAGQLLGAIDVEAVSKGLTAGLQRAAEPVSDKPLGAFQIMKQLKDPDVSAALQVGFAFLKGFGQAVRESEGKKASTDG